MLMRGVLHDWSAQRGSGAQEPLTKGALLSPKEPFGGKSWAARLRGLRLGSI